MSVHKVGGSISKNEDWLFPQHHDPARIGKMSQDDIERRGWEHDPFDGLKMMKSDLNYYYESDKELQQSESKIVYYKTMIETLKEIVDNLKWRHSTIKNVCTRAHGWLSLKKAIWILKTATGNCNAL